MRPLAPLLELLAPARCLACGEISASPWCRRCGDPPASPPAACVAGVPVLAAGAYAGSLAAAIRRFKYGRCPELAAPLASLLLPVLPGVDGAELASWVPVPLSAARLVERGYNQAALLSRALARQVRARSLPRLLVRSRDTPRQARLGREARLENVRGVFTLAAPCPARVVLVDDVVTTGATVHGCLAALCSAGAEVLAVVALARAGVERSAEGGRREHLASPAAASFSTAGVAADRSTR